MTMRATHRPRGMTLLEIMVVTAVGVVVATAASVSVADQVKRARALDAAKSALHPHMVARDRAVARRSCVETVLIPPRGVAFARPNDGLSGSSCPPATPCVPFPDDAQRDTPRVAVVEWDTCEAGAFMTGVTFYDLDGDITVTPYDSPDGRAVFGPDGGLTALRPRAAAKGVIIPCQPAPTSGAVAVAAAPPAASTLPCTPPGPPVPPPDIHFSATTYFGDAEQYRIGARGGSGQQRSIPADPCLRDPALCASSAPPPGDEWEGCWGDCGDGAGAVGPDN